MNLIKHYLELMLNYIDNGTFFRDPMKLLYIIFGVLGFAAPAAYIYFLYDAWDNLIPSFLDTWPKLTLGLTYILVLVYLIAIAYAHLVFWLHRKDKLHQTVRVGDKIVAIPVYADFIQCAGEAAGIFPAISMLGAYVIFFVIGLLNGFKFIHYGPFDFGDYLEGIIYLIIGFVLLAIACFIIGYLIILVAHVISERLRIKAMLANDVRDLGDIHRAATMTEK